MPTPSAHLGLLKPTVTDTFSTQDIANNWGKIDSAPGTTICTSSTRPSTWGAGQTGMKILETDTLLEWLWTGAAFVRMYGTGILKTQAGQPAIAVQSADVTNTNSGAFTLVVAVQNVVVPDGQRPLIVTCSYKFVDATHGLSVGAIMRSATSNSGPTLGLWQIAGDSTAPISGGAGSGESFVAYERAGLAPGVYSWSFQFRIAAQGGGGTATVHTDTQGGSATISVREG